MNCKSVGEKIITIKKGKQMKRKGRHLKLTNLSKMSKI